MTKEEKLFNERLERFKIWKTWVLENHKTPRINSLNLDERKMAVMMSNIWKKINKDPNYSIIITEYLNLKKKYPYSEDFRKKRDSKTNLNEIIEWSKEHKRLPQQKSQDEVERKLSYRCHLLMANLRKKPFLNKKLLDEYEELKASLKLQKGV